VRPADAHTFFGTDAEKRNVPEFRWLLKRFRPQSLRYTHEGVPFATTKTPSVLLNQLFGSKGILIGSDAERFGFGSHDFDLLLQYPDTPAVIPVVAQFGSAIASYAYESLTKWLGAHGWSWITNKAKWGDHYPDPTRLVTLDDPLMSLAVALANNAAYTFHVTQGRWDQPKSCDGCGGSGFTYSSIGGGDPPCSSCGGTGLEKVLIPPRVRVISPPEAQ
jgi:hypothetical protein